jgi:hypothetical protein
MFNPTRLWVKVSRLRDEVNVKANQMCGLPCVGNLGV